MEEEKSRVTVFINSNVRKQFGAKCQLEETNMSEASERLFAMWVSGEINLSQKNQAASSDLAA